MNLFSLVSRVWWKNLVELLKLENIPADSLSEIVEETQRRWVYDKKKWLQSGGTSGATIVTEQRSEAVRSLLANLGFIEAVPVTDTGYDYTLVLGGKILSMMTRASFVFFNLWEGHGQIFLLSSSRCLYEDEIAVAKSDERLTRGGYHDGVKTEAQLFQKIWDSLPPVPESFGELCTGCCRLSARLIDTPLSFGSGFIPTTEDTVRYWLQEVKPKPGKVLVVTNQPFILHQGLVVKMLLGKRFKVTAAGNSKPQNIQTSQVLDRLAKYLYQLQKATESK